MGTFAEVGTITANAGSLMANSFSTRYSARIDERFRLMSQLNPLDSGREYIKAERLPISYTSMAGFLFLNYSVILLVMALLVCLLKI